MVKKLQWSEAVIFFLMANIVMLLGSDFPPPAGFIWITVTSLALAALQWLYVGLIWQKGIGKKLVVVTALGSFFLGILIALLFALAQGQWVAESWIFFTITGIVFLLYGMLLLGINWPIQKVVTNA